MKDSHTITGHIHAAPLFLAALLAAFVAYSFLPDDISDDGSLGTLPDSTELPPLIPDIEELKRDTVAALSVDSSSGIVTGPFSASGVGLTVGERLKRLDSLMLVVPADSLEGLMAEYDLLLDSALGSRGVSTPSYVVDTSATTIRSNISAPSDTPTSPIATTEAVTPSMEASSPEEVDSGAMFASLVQDPPKLQIEEPAPPPIVQERPAPSRVETSTPEVAIVQADSPPPSDLEVISRRSNSGYIRSVPHSARKRTNKSTVVQSESNSSSSSVGKRSNSTTPTSTAASDHTKRSNHGKEATVRERSRPGSSGVAASDRRASRTSVSGKASSPSGRTASVKKRSASASLQRRYTEGLAKFRAGKYTSAITLLTPVASSNKSYRSTARYYLALAQERTGNLESALRNMRSLRRGSGRIALRSQLASARLLARTGNRSEARKELLRMTRSRSSSRYSAVALKMLQQL